MKLSISDICPNLMHQAAILEPEPSL